MFLKVVSTGDGNPSPHLPSSLLPYTHLKDAALHGSEVFRGKGACLSHGAGEPGAALENGVNNLHRQGFISDKVQHELKGRAFL